MNFDKYYYENFSIDIPFDNLNPRYVMAAEGVDEIITHVVNSTPFTISVEQIKDQALLKALIEIDVLKEKKNKLALAAPVFVDKDSEILKQLSYDVAQHICDILISNKTKIIKIVTKIDNGFSFERNLYHLLCGNIFDGKIFDYLEENDLVTTNKIHKSGLDYLVILYEQAPRMNEYSNRLFCSFNRLVTEEGGFVSFGDSDGNRKDYYRYFRLNELNTLNDEMKKYIAFEPNELVHNFNLLLAGQAIEPAYLKSFEYFHYLQNGKLCVPIYDRQIDSIIEELYFCTLELIHEPLTESLQKIEQRTDLLSIIHGVNIKDISNEIYHLIFGEINQLLIESKMVSNPKYICGEGRFLRSFETRMRL